MASVIPTSTRPGRSGFTLIELLVVIAIMVVLAALLFPALKNSMNGAKAAQCLSNMKSLGGVFSSYIYEGKIVQYEYMPGQYERNWKSILISRGYANPLTLNKITYCPSWNPDFSVYQGNPNNWFSYGFDVGALQVTYDSASGYTTVASPANTQAIEQPSKCILLADSIARNPAAWTYDKQDKRKNYQVAQICISGPYGSWDSEGCLHLRHAKRANILFLDGHAQAMVPQEIRNMLNDYNRSTTPFYYWDENLKDNVQR